MLFRSLINATTGELINITDDAYSNFNPRWVMNGNAVIFESDRYGMKNHASWGSTADILMAFTNQEAYDRYRLSDEDFALLKELEKSQKKPAATPEKGKKDAKKDSKKDDKKSDKKDGEKDGDKKDDKKITIEADGIQDRIVRLTPFSSNIADAYVDNDGENFYFIASVENSYDMWNKSLRKGNTTQFKKIGSPTSIVADAAGKNLFLIGKDLRKMSIPSGNMTNISFSGSQEINLAKEREYMYDYILDQEEKRFLVEDMFGTDWKGLGKNYRKFLPHINNNYDFSELASELLGELNVSHTGSGYRAGGANEPTASLGLLYDMAYTGEDRKSVV